MHGLNEGCPELRRLCEIWSSSKFTRNRERRVADGNMPSSSMLGGDRRLLGRLPRPPFWVDLLRQVLGVRSRLWRRIPNLLHTCPQACRSVLGHCPLRAPGYWALFAFPHTTLAVLLTPFHAFSRATGEPWRSDQGVETLRLIIWIRG